MVFSISVRVAIISIKLSEITKSQNFESTLGWTPWCRLVWRNFVIWEEDIAKQTEMASICPHMKVYYLVPNILRITHICNQNHIIWTLIIRHDHWVWPLQSTYLTSILLIRDEKSLGWVSTGNKKVVMKNDLGIVLSSSRFASSSKIKLFKNHLFFI